MSSKARKRVNAVMRDRLAPPRRIPREPDDFTRGIIELIAIKNGIGQDEDDEPASPAPGDTPKDAKD